VFRNGDHAQCPQGYPERFVFYGGTEGEASCAECTCAARPGAGCRVAVSTYTDAGCAVLFAQANIWSTELEKCDDGLPPADLSSMSASWLTNDPGSCEPSGGEPTGEVKPADPATFCCIAVP
jgi:hypothetical protein